MANKNMLDEFRALSEQQALDSDVPMETQIIDEPEVEDAVATDPRLKAALDASRKKKLFAGLLGGFQQLNQAGAYGTGFKADMSTSDQMMKDANNPLNEYKDMIKGEASTAKAKLASEGAERDKAQHEQTMKMGKIKLGKQELDLTDLKKTSDSGSEESIFARQEYVKMLNEVGETVPDNINEMSAKTIHDSDDRIKSKLKQLFKFNHQKQLKAMSNKQQTGERIDGQEFKSDESEKSRQHSSSEKKIDRDMKSEERKEAKEIRAIQETEKKRRYEATLDERKASREDRTNRHEDRMTLKEQQKLDRDVETISKRLDKGGIISQKNSFDKIDAYLASKGGALGVKDTYDKVSIPGMGVGGGMRPDMFTPVDAVEFRQSVQSLANQLLKQRSGAAVTDQEYARFLKEVGSGNFSTESNLMSGLTKMKKDLADQESNIIKSADPVAQEEYKRRMGMMSGGDSTPTVVKKQYSPSRNKTKIVYSDGTEEIIDGK